MDTPCPLSVQFPIRRTWLYLPGFYRVRVIIVGCVPWMFTSCAAKGEASGFRLLEVRVVNETKSKCGRKSAGARIRTFAFFNIMSEKLPLSADVVGQFMSSTGDKKTVNGAPRNQPDNQYHRDLPHPHLHCSKSPLSRLQLQLSPNKVPVSFCRVVGVQLHIFIS